MKGFISSKLHPWHPYRFAYKTQNQYKCDQQIRFSFRIMYLFNSEPFNSKFNDFNVSKRTVLDHRVAFTIWIICVVAFLIKWILKAPYYGNIKNHFNWKKKVITFTHYYLWFINGDSSPYDQNLTSSSVIVHKIIPKY